MTEEQFLARVRDEVARQLQQRGLVPTVTAALRPGDASHALFTLSRPDGGDDCLIEPAVRCSHCGYCKSYGH